MRLVREAAKRSSWFFAKTTSKLRVVTGHAAAFPRSLKAAAAALVRLKTSPGLAPDFTP